MIISFEIMELLRKEEKKQLSSLGERKLHRLIKKNHIFKS